MEVKSKARRLRASFGDCKPELWQPECDASGGGVVSGEERLKPIVFTAHARLRMEQRGTREEDVRQAIQSGQREQGQRGLHLYRLNLEFKREWDGRYYAIQQVVPVVAEEERRMVVITVYTFYF